MWNTTRQEVRKKRSLTFSASDLQWKRQTHETFMVSFGCMDTSSVHIWPYGWEMQGFTGEGCWERGEVRTSLQPPEVNCGYGPKISQTTHWCGEGEKQLFLLDFGSCSVWISIPIFIQEWFFNIRALLIHFSFLLCCLHTFAVCSSAPCIMLELCPCPLQPSALRVLPLDFVCVCFNKLTQSIENQI